MVLTEEEKELLIFGLHMRKCFIETGDPLMSAADAKIQKKEKSIKALSDDQYELIVKINKLIKKLESS